MLESLVMFALIDVHLIFHALDLGTMWDAASCACLGGLAVLAQGLKQAHYERQ